MASELNKIRQEIYDTYKDSKYLAMSDNDLAINLYRTDKYKDKFSSFEEFNVYINKDADGKKTPLEDRKSPYNSSNIEKIQESLFGALPDQSIFGFAPESFRKTVGAVVPNVAQSIGSIVTSVDDYAGGVIPQSVREGAADYSTSLATLLAGKSQIQTKVDPETGSKIGVVNPKTSGLGTVVREIGEFSLASPFKTVGVLTDAMKAKKLKKIQEKIPSATRLSSKYSRRYDIGKYLVAGEIGSQVSMTPEEAVIGNMLGDFIGDDKGMLTKLVDYVSADANKTEGENRIALLFDGLFTAGAVGGVLRYGGKAFRSSKEMFRYFKNFKNTASSEKKKEFIETVKTTVEESPISTKTPKELRGPESDDVLKLWRFSDNPVARKLDFIWGGLFRSEGTLTPKAYKMMNLNKNAQIAWAAKGEYLMTSIDSQIKTMAKSVDNVLTEKQLEDLFDNYLFGGKEIVTLPESMRKTAKETRDTIDELSEMIGQSRGVDKELRKAIKENLGTYLRTTYKKFEDPNYKPSDEVKDSAIDFIYGKYLKSVERKNGALSYLKTEYPDRYKEIVKQKAEASINNLLRDAKYSDDFFQFINTINAGKDSKIIFDKKKNIAKEIQNLLGKEDNTSTRVFSTINTLSDFLYKQNTFEKLRIFGENKYLYPEKVGPVGQFNTQIKGKQFGALDGMWTTDSMATNFLEPLAIKYGINHPLYDNLSTGMKLLFATKGFSQASKTVLNNVTHERNFQSSAVIMMSNGLNPFSGLSKGKLDVWEPIQVAWNNVTKGTDEDLVNLYNKYLRLGITNQNAKIGDIRALIKSAEKTGVAGHANKILDASLKETVPVVGGLSIRKGYKGIERAYVAEDDIWKIAVFEKELDTLRKAFPDRSIADLEQQAADLVRNTMPTYDMVPAAYKLLRYSPVGNYFSFHAERFRNTYHTYKQAVKEISSDNKVLNTRGWQRLGAKTTVGGLGGLGVSYGSLKLAGVGEDEDKYIKSIMKKDYHGDNWVYDTHDKTGDLLFVDTKGIDPDAPVNDAVLKPIMDIIGTGNVVEEELDNKIIEAFTKSLSGVLSPFLDETILTGAIFDLTVRKGIDVEGFEVPGWNDTKNKTFETRMNNVVAGFQHIYNDAIEPAMVSNMKGLAISTSGKEDKYGFKKSTDLELYKNITGFNFMPINEENLLKQLNNKIYDFKSEKSIAEGMIDANYESLRNPITEKDLYDQFLDGNRQYYRQYVKTFDTIYGLKQLMRIDDVRESKGIPKRYNLTDKKIRNRLKDLGLSKLEIDEIFNRNYTTADFVALKVSENQLDKFMAMHPDADRARIEATLDNMYTQLQRLPLIQLDDEYTQTEREALEFLKSERLPKATGGLIEGEDEVPYTKENPADRVDPFTGEPYSDQMARLGLAQGGLTEAEVLAMVEDKAWFQRATQPGGELYKGKHTLLTKSSGDGQKEYLYPTIREVNGKLVDLGDKAFDVAMEKKDYIIFEGKDKEKKATEVSKKISDLIEPMRELNKKMTEDRLGFQDGGDVEGLTRIYDEDQGLKRVSPIADVVLGLGAFKFGKGLKEVGEEVVQKATMPKTVLHGRSYPGRELKEIKSANAMSPKPNEGLQSGIFTTTDDMLARKYAVSYGKNTGVYKLDTSKISSFKNLKNIGKDKVIKSYKPSKKFKKSLDDAILNANSKKESKILSNFKNQLGKDNYITRVGPTVEKFLVNNNVKVVRTNPTNYLRKNAPEKLSKKRYEDTYILIEDMVKVKGN
jgi:hypothetical protein